MDELTLLRRLDADAPTPSRAVAEDAFAALEARMRAADHVAPRRRRRRRIRWAALATAGAAALVAALVLTDAIGVAGLRGGASAQAAELLDHAADTTIFSVDPTVAPGQYRRVELRSVHTVDGGLADGRHGIFSVHEDRTTWIPADLHDEWTEVRYPGRSAGQYWGADAKAVAADWDRRVAGQRPEVLHGKAGQYFGGDPREDPDAVNALPHDPRVLLNHVYRITFGSGNSADDEALVFIGDTLSTGYADAATRAALYRAAALIPGVVLTAHSATLNGAEGVAIGRVEPKYGIRQDLIIDPANGDLIGQRRVATRDLDDGSANAGDTLSWSSATTTVVDAVPAQYRG